MAPLRAQTQQTPTPMPQLVTCAPVAAAAGALASATALTTILLPAVREAAGAAKLRTATFLAKGADTKALGLACRETLVCADCSCSCMVAAWAIAEQLCQDGGEKGYTERATSGIGPYYPAAFWVGPRALFTSPFPRSLIASTWRGLCVPSREQARQGAGPLHAARSPPLRTAPPSHCHGVWHA